MEETILLDRGDEVFELPPGFRFHPTDEEIVTSYLTEKVKEPSFTCSAIGEVDLNKCEPWELPKKAKMGEKEWYFFCQRDRKYPTGMRTNRATEAGYWKATGKDKEIFRGENNLVGMKKTLVFYRGRAPKGEKTNWVMHEYRLEGKLNYYTLTRGAKDEWVVCRVFHKSMGIKKTPIHELVMRGDSFGDDFFDTSSLPPLVDPQPYPTRPGSSSFSDGDNSHNNNGTDFKLGMGNSSRSPDGNCLSNYLSRSIVDHSTNRAQNLSQLLPSTSYQPPYSSSTLYPQIQASNSPHFSFKPTPSMPGYNFHASSFGGINIEQSIFKGLSARNEAFELDMDKHQNCKVEQFSSNQSMVSLSQDTGISNDINTVEISSKQETASDNHMVYGDLEGPSMDFDLLLQDYS